MESTRPGCECLPVLAILRVGVLWVLATIFPLALWQWAPPFVDSTYGPGHQPFEFLGLTLSALAVGVAAWRVRVLQAQGPLDTATVFRIVLLLLPVLHVIQLVSEHSTPSWDWRCYVAAGEALRNGVSPYSDCYLYPPLVAQVLAGSYPLVEALGRAVGLQSGKYWAVSFFIWQSVQVLMVAAAAYLLDRLARRVGLAPLVAAGVVAMLLVIDNPLMRTVRHNQVNLVVLNLVLLAMDRLAARPSAAGALVALAVHVKLMPAVIVLPWAMERRWRAVVVAVVTSLLLAGIQTLSGGDLWPQFFSHAPSFVQGEYFRDNSLTSLVFNGVRVPVDMFGGDVRGWLGPLRVGGMVASLVVAGWVIRGMFARSREGSDPDLLGAEGLALMLLLAPIAWEHHYVWALPLAVLAVARCWRAAPLRIGTALLLIFGLPTFDVFPLSYHRLVGLLLLLSALRPSRVAQPSSD